jgi:hypothetical protein
MKHISTFQNRTLLVQSLRAVEASEDELRNALSTALARSEQDPELSDTPDIMANLLLRFLIEQVRQVVGSGEPGDLERYRSEHRLHGIDGRHYSRFGDALVPVLGNILGAAYPRQTASAWSDAYWAIMQRMRQGDEARSSAAPALTPAPTVAEPIA